MPFFSVIIPLYNKAPYIRRSLNSVLAQSFNDFELIVIDDGSNDGGGSIVASYGDSRIRLIRQENTGESGARNRGVVEAKAAWLALLDADDEYLPNFLEKMHEAIVKHPEIGFVFSNLLWTGLSGVTRKMINSRYDHFQVIDNYCDFLCEHVLGGATSSSVVVQKSLLRQAGGFPVGITRGADTDTFLRLGWITKAGYEPSVLAVYHNEVIGSFWDYSERFSPKRRRPVYPDLLISTYNDWKRKGIFPDQMEKSWRRCIRGYILHHVHELVLYGDKKGAWGIFWKELKWDDWWKLTTKLTVIFLIPCSLLDILRNVKRKLLPGFASAFL